MSTAEWHFRINRQEQARDWSILMWRKKSMSKPKLNKGHRSLVLHLRWLKEWICRAHKFNFLKMEEEWKVKIKNSKPSCRNRLQHNVTKPKKWRIRISNKMKQRTHSDQSSKNHWIMTSTRTNQYRSTCLHFTCNQGNFLWASWSTASCILTKAKTSWREPISSTEWSSQRGLQATVMRRICRGSCLVKLLKGQWREGVFHKIQIKEISMVTMTIRTQAGWEIQSLTSLETWYMKPSIVNPSGCWRRNINDFRNTRTIRWARAIQGTTG